LRYILAICTVLFLVIPAGATSRTVTLYLNGARFENEFSTAGGLIEVSLPAAMQDGSLRVKPLDGALIEHVEIVQARPDPKRIKELEKLADRRNAIMDRLRALEAKEAVFKAAAKSQSAKAPHKTKSNPEPLASVRKGTEYAIAQLEGVYRTRRMVESDLTNYFTNY